MLCMSTLAHAQAKNGQPLTLNGLTGRQGCKEVLISGSPSKVNLIDCQNISILPANDRLLVEGGGILVPQTIYSSHQLGGGGVF